MRTSMLPPPTHTAFKLTLLRGGQKGRRGNLLMDRHAAAKRLAMTKTQGFTLIELAIVIVIIGLLAGGVLVGRDMIRAAELRSVTTEYEKYVAALNLFKEKYMGLPGDLKNATAFWGAMTNCGAASPSGTGTQTCNGNGDTILHGAAGNGQTSEEFLAWQHLANAGLIEGKYTGISGSGGTAHSVISQNVPAGKMSGTGWSFIYTGDVTDPSEPNWFVGYYGQLMQLGTQNGAERTGGSALLPEELWAIDSKIDDGKPGYGTIKTTKNANSPCPTTNDPTTAEYNVTLKEIRCLFRATMW